MAADAFHDPHGETPIPDAALRSALEFAVKVAVGNRRKKPSVPVPAALLPLLGQARLRATALRTVRSVLDADDAFRTDVAARATPDHVDEVGRWWLQRPDGWRTAITEALSHGDAQPLPSSGAAAGSPSVTTVEKRRQAAERKADLAERALAASRDDLARAERRTAEVVAERDRLAKRVEVLETQLAEARAGSSRHRKGAVDAQGRLQEADEQLADLRRRLDETETARDEALRRLAEVRDPIDLDEVRSLLARAQRALGPAPARRATRTPMSVPGGLHVDTVATAEHFLRTPGVVVMVDGYNVAKQAWPHLDNEHQREQVVGLCERVAQRFAAKVHVVFDGQDLAGAHARRQTFVHVTFTNSGEEADDRLRDMVAALDPSVPVVVVTSDEKVRRWVRAHGANVLKNHVLPELDHGRR